MNDFMSIQEAHAFSVLSLMTPADDTSPLTDYDNAMHGHSMLRDLKAIPGPAYTDLMARFNRTFGADLPRFDMKLDPWFAVPGHWNRKRNFKEQAMSGFVIEIKGSAMPVYVVSEYGSTFKKYIRFSTDIRCAKGFDDKEAAEIFAEEHGPHWLTVTDISIGEEEISTADEPPKRPERKY